jgi:type III restriction enzyme
MPRAKKTTAKTIQASPELFNLDGSLKTAPCVPAIRVAVDAWRLNRYAGATLTTKLLLNHWFHNDHRLVDRSRFQYHAESQQRAMETLIYIYEIEKIRSWKKLVERFAPKAILDRLPQEDDFARYCIKMATGSGKTKVMSLAIAWHYFNALNENDTAYAKQFLLIAPNVIVLERLRTDFGGGRLFKSDPIVPIEFKPMMNELQFYVRGDSHTILSEGDFYLTNIQQLYERDEKTDDANPALALIGGNAKPKLLPQGESDFKQRIIDSKKPLLVLNDEAHHTHDEDSTWNTVIRDLAGEVPLVSQLDFSATPRHSKGSLFLWTIFDYPLKQAILHGIVKRPVKGIMKKNMEVQSTDVAKKYEAYIVAGVNRWREYRTELTRYGKKPILFFMMTTTSEAEDIANYLRRKFPQEFADDKCLVIHTDKKGEISGKDLDAARKASREIDDDKSPVNAVVSVMMLREGWDVQNITVVVGLRPYSSKAAILPEQAIGRGLRLMFRGKGYGYTERVDIIGTEKFMEFVDDLEKLEEIKLDEFEVGKEAFKVIDIQPLDEKREFDIRIPMLTPRLERKKSLADEIAALDVMQFRSPVVPMKEADLKPEDFKYEGVDALTKEKLFLRDYQIPEVQNFEEVFAYYAEVIMKDIKLPSQFAALAPKVKDFFKFKAFGKEVTLEGTELLRAVCSRAASYTVKNTFVAELRKVIVDENIPSLISNGKSLYEMDGFPYNGLALNAHKTIFNLLPCGNQFEKTFAEFLDAADEVAAFMKLPKSFKFYIEYTDSAMNLRHYEPDFVARLTSGVHYLIETKGQEDIDVSRKDEAAIIWCKNATTLTGTTWNYLKVRQSEFQNLQPREFDELFVLNVN